jgi:hypothetical protein
VHKVKQWLESEARKAASTGRYQGLPVEKKQVYCEIEER